MVFSAFFWSFQKPGEPVKSSFSAIFAFIESGSKTPPDFFD